MNTRTETLQAMIDRVAYVGLSYGVPKSERFLYVMRGSIVAAIATSGNWFIPHLNTQGQHLETLITRFQSLPDEDTLARLFPQRKQKHEVGHTMETYFTKMLTTVP